MNANLQKNLLPRIFATIAVYTIILVRIFFIVMIVAFVVSEIQTNMSIAIHAEYVLKVMVIIIVMPNLMKVSV
jgi:hypothetical protein